MGVDVGVVFYIGTLACVTKIKFITRKILINNTSYRAVKMIKFYAVTWSVTKHFEFRVSDICKCIHPRIAAISQETIDPSTPPTKGQPTGTAALSANRWAWPGCNKFLRRHSWGAYNMALVDVVEINMNCFFLVILESK